MKMLAVAAAPGVASFELTVVVTFVSWAKAVPVAVTLTLKEHVAPAASVAPARLMALLPAVAVMVPPSQVPTNPLGVATTNPVGSTSRNASPVRVTALLGLLRTKAKLVVLPAPMLTSPKVLLRFGGLETISVAVAVFPVPKLEATVTLLTLIPSVTPATLTVIAQVAPAAIDPPLKLTLPTVATATPPHVLVKLLGDAVTTPAG